MIDNQKLAKQIKQGDIRAYELLFKAYYQALCNFANSYLNNIAESEDLVQEVFVKIWDKRHELNVTTSIKSYLFQAVKNSCFNHQKHQKVQRKHKEHLFHQSESSTDSTDQLETKEPTPVLEAPEWNITWHFCKNRRNTNGIGAKTLKKWVKILLAYNCIEFHLFCVFWTTISG